MPTAKTVLIPCESLPRLAGSSGPRPFNRCEDAFRHALPRVITIHEPAADGKLTTVAVAVGICWMVAVLRNLPREVAGILNGQNGFLLRIRFDRHGSQNAHSLAEGVK